MKIGLALAGGGGKGAYHIGVWKALNEYGITKYITAVSGTSVGALNMLLFACGDIAVAERVWSNISPNKVLTDGTSKIFDILPDFIEGRVESVYNKMSGFTSMFSREGLQSIIDENIDLYKVSNSKLNLCACAYNCTKSKIEYLKINGQTPETIKKIVFASSALPIVFGTQDINGSQYLDGGLKDNVPVKPLIAQNVDMVIAAHLGQDSCIKNIYPNNNIIEIVPLSDQGGLISGTMDFTASGARERISQGYRDTITIIEPVKQMIESQFRYINEMGSIYSDEKNFNKAYNSARTSIESRKSRIDELRRKNR